MSISRMIISLFVVYHLACAITIPQTPNAIADKMRPYVLPYAKMLVMVGTWGFFAPDPGPPPTYIQWEALDKEGKPISSGVYPEEPSHFFWAEERLRRVSSVRFMVSEPDRMMRMMVPFICHQNPKANSVRVKMDIYPVPSAEDVANGKGQLMNPETMEQKSMGMDFCGQLI